MQRAHAQWLIEMLDAEGLSQPGWPDKGSLDHVAPERENCAAALRWASSHRMNEIVARLTSPMVGVWIMTGQLHEAERWMTLVLEHESEYQGRLAAQVATSARILAWHRGHHADGAVLAQRALALWREAGDLDAIGRETIAIGTAACEDGDLARGRAAYEQAIKFAREHALPADVLANALIDLGDVEMVEGDLTAARLHCEEGLALVARESGNASVALLNLCHIAMLEGRPADAAEPGRSALESAIRSGAALTIAWACIEFAWPLAALGEPGPSARLLGSALEFLDRAGAQRQLLVEECEAEVQAILHDRLDRQTVQTLLQEGRETPLDTAARDALSSARALTDP